MGYNGGGNDNDGFYVRAAQKMIDDLARADRSKELADIAEDGRKPLDKVQTFETGATRSADAHKHDFEGYLSPTVLERFGDYMTQHRVQRDGNLRSSDNWQKGIPIHKYLKSLLRHTFDLWRAYRGTTVIDKDTNQAMTMLDILMAILFNVQGMAHEMLKRGGNQTYTVCDATRQAIEEGREFSFVPCSPYNALPTPDRVPFPEPGSILRFIPKAGYHA